MLSPSYYRTLKNYPQFVALYLGFTILMVIFNTFSFIISEPFLKILFERTNVNIKPTEFAWEISTIIDYTKYQLNLYVEENGQLSALTLLCWTGVVIFFLKNLFRYSANVTMGFIHHGIVRDLRNLLYKQFIAPSACLFFQRT